MFKKVKLLEQQIKMLIDRVNVLEAKYSKLEERLNPSTFGGRKQG